MCQLDLPEYARTTQTRLHLSFGGHEAREQIECHLQMLFLVHLVVPGWKQAGLVAVVGQTFHQALPAVAHVLEQLSRTEGLDYGKIPGRAQR